MKRRKKHKKTAKKTTRRARRKKVAAASAHPHKTHKINGDRFMKNRILVFKLRKEIKGEIQDDKRELKTLKQLKKRANRFAA